MYVNDLAIQRGYGVFDFFKTIGGKFIFIEDHIDRFFYSAEKMRLPIGKTKQQLKEILSGLADQNKTPDSGIRVTLTGGYSPDGYSLARPNLIITQKQLVINPAETVVGIKLVTYDHQRQLPDVKTSDYLMAIWLKPYILDHGADDVLYHQNGKITESPRSNFFMVTQDNHIVTPVNNILKGVTRKYVLQLASESYLVEERDVLTEEIMTAKETFITSTTKGVVPVLGIDNCKIGGGSTDGITHFLQKKLHELIYS